MFPHRPVNHIMKDTLGLGMLDRVSDGSQEKLSKNLTNGCIESVRSTEAAGMKYMSQGFSVMLQP